MQGNLANADYNRTSTDNVKAIKRYEAKIINDPEILKLDEELECIDINWTVTTVNDEMRVDPIMNTIKKITRYKLLGYIFVKQACKIRYGNFIQVLDNKYAKEQVNYFPVSMEPSYKVIIN